MRFISPIKGGPRSLAYAIPEAYRVTFSARAHPVRGSSLSRPVRQALYRRDCEQHELRILQETLRPADRVLELGSGMGLLSALCEGVGKSNVTTFEANQEMEPIIRANSAAIGDIETRWVISRHHFFQLLKFFPPA